MYGLHRRLNSDTGHVDHKSELQTAHVRLRSLHMRNTRQFFTAIIRDNEAAQYSNTLVRFKSLSNYQICICVFAYLLQSK